VIDALAARLMDLAARKETITYGGLAKELAIPGPGTIAKLTSALEALMEQDATAGLPLGAALCKARLSQLPGPGFFHTATRLKCYSGPPNGPLARDFATKTRIALFDLAASR
jgi:hypothetical protein